MQKAAAKLQHLNILLADDDEVTRAVLAGMLQPLCRHLFQAKDGQEALELYENNQVHIVILDYRMPFLNGVEVASYIRQKDKNIPIFIVSAHTDKNILLSAISLNLISYIEKPIDYGLFMNSLKRSVELLEENHRLFTPLSTNLFYDHINKSLLVNGRIETLSKLEVNFIELLIQKKGKLLSKEEVEDLVFEKPVDANTLRNMVYRLRKKFDSEEKELITTVKDIGYILNNHLSH